LFSRLTEEEESKLKLFKKSHDTLLNITIFPGSNTETQEPIEIKIPKILAPSIKDTNSTLDLLGSDFAPIMNEDEIDPLELRKENNKLRTELAERLNFKQNDNSIEMLKEITDLKEQLAKLNDSSDQYLQGYEKRFTNYKKQIKELENKVLNLSQDLKDKNGVLTESDMKEVNKLISETQSNLIKEKESRLIAENELRQLRDQTKLPKVSEDYSKLKEELGKQEMYRKNLVEHFQASILKLTDDLRESKSQKEEMESKLASSNKREKELHQNIVKLNEEHKEEEKKLKLLQQKFEKVLLSTNRAECPVCSEIIMQQQLIEHVNGCLK